MQLNIVSLTLEMEASYIANLKRAVNVVDDICKLDKPIIPIFTTEGDAERVALLKFNQREYKDTADELKEGLEAINSEVRNWEQMLSTHKQRGSKADRDWETHEDTKLELGIESALNKGNPLLRTYKTRLNQIELEIDNTIVRIQRQGLLGGQSRSLHPKRPMHLFIQWSKPNVSNCRLWN